VPAVRWGAAVLLLAGVLAGPAAGQTDDRTRLKKAVERWVARDADDYRFTVRRGADGRRYRVVVRNGRTVRGAKAPASSDEELFEWAQRAVALDQPTKYHRSGLPLRAGPIRVTGIHIG
jgi:hypothetical protein